MRPTGEEGQPTGASAAHSKADLRARLSRARAVRERRDSAELALAVRCLAACAGASVVAAYVARPAEPQTAQVLDALRAADIPVLLPALTGDPDWAWYAGDEHLVAGPHGIRQPDGPRLGAGALAAADFIWLPGLAGTPDGRRLGAGGGWYDRALAEARPDATLGLVLFDDEILEDVPVEAWDRDVDLIVTEIRRIDCRD